MEQTNFVRLFGDSPLLRILDALLDNVGSDYSKKEVQELAGISKGALFQNWHRVEEIGLVKVTRKFGKTKLYTLNTGNRAVKDLLRLEMDLIEATSPHSRAMQAKALSKAKKRAG